MIPKDRAQHKVGEVVDGKKLDPSVPRVAAHRFKVALGSSCRGCSFTGLGHRTCRLVACERTSREDGNSVVYKQEPSDEG